MTRLSDKILSVIITICITASVTLAQQAPMPGSDRDEHGCIGSAGYTWSAMKNKCVRLWEAGIKLQPIDKSNTSAAYLIFSADRKQIEAYVIGSKPYPFIMMQIKKGTYIYGMYRLVSTKNNLLYKNNKVAYKSE